jgi:hypothetical protein
MTHHAYQLPQSPRARLNDDLELLLSKKNMQGNLSLNTDRHPPLTILVAMKLNAGWDSSLRETSVVLLLTQANSTALGTKPSAGSANDETRLDDI